MTGEAERGTPHPGEDEEVSRHLFDLGEKEVDDKLEIEDKTGEQNHNGEGEEEAHPGRCDTARSPPRRKEKTKIDSTRKRSSSQDQDRGVHPLFWLLFLALYKPQSLNVR